MGPNEIFGAPIEAVLIIIVFWTTIFAIIFGIDAFGNSGIAMIACFLIIGTTFLIGHFGWQILVIPALAIIGGAGFLIWKLVSRF